MAAHGEIRWPPLGRFNGRLWGESHGRRHGARTDQPPAFTGTAVPPHRGTQQLVAPKCRFSPHCSTAFRHTEVPAAPNAATAASV